MARTGTTRRPAPRARLDVDERRAQLLALGLAMFSETPYDEVSIDDLARAGGVSKGLLYHYFPTKRDLYVAALGHAAHGLLEETIPHHDGTPEERLHRGLTTYLDFVTRHRKAYVALMRGGIGSDPEVAAIVEETRRTFVARIIHEGLPGAENAPILRAALRGWIGFVEATSLDWADHPEVARDDLVELLSAVIFDAVTRAAAIAAKAPAAVSPKEPEAKPARRKR
jgi:AcrR family transcriptional regulator